MLSVVDVALEHDGRCFLRDVNLTVRPGELLALVGPNGVGKTTLLRAMAGLARPPRGTIALDGRPVATLTPRERGGGRIALVEADGPVPDDLCVDDLVAMGRLAFRPWWRWAPLPEDRTAVDDALGRTGLAPLARRRVSTLSSGERQRAWIALALAQRPRLLLLDEPTSHLDVRHALDALELLRAIVDAAGGGAAGVVVLHDLNLAALFADRIALLGDGRLLLCDRPEVVLAPEPLLRAYGVRIDVRRTGDGRIFTLPARRRGDGGADVRAGASDDAEDARALPVRRNGAT